LRKAKPRIYVADDIGGFEGKPDPGLYKRWLAFGCLSSHSRLHGSGSYRVCILSL